MYNCIESHFLAAEHQGYLWMYRLIVQVICCASTVVVDSK